MYRLVRVWFAFLLPPLPFLDVINGSDDFQCSKKVHDPSILFYDSPLPISSELYFAFVRLIFLLPALLHSCICSSTIIISTALHASLLPPLYISSSRFDLLIRDFPIFVFLDYRVTMQSLLPPHPFVRSNTSLSLQRYEHTLSLLSLFISAAFGSWYFAGRRRTTPAVATPVRAWLVGQLAASLVSAVVGTTLGSIYSVTTPRAIKPQALVKAATETKESANETQEVIAFNFFTMAK